MSDDYRPVVTPSANERDEFRKRLNELEAFRRKCDREGFDRRKWCESINQRLDELEAASAVDDNTQCDLQKRVERFEAKLQGVVDRVWERIDELAALKQCAANDDEKLRELDKAVGELTVRSFHHGACLMDLASAERRAAPTAALRWSLLASSVACLVVAAVITLTALGAL